MKFAVFLALIGVALTQEIPEMEDEDWEDLDEEDLEEDLDLTFNDRNRRLEVLADAQRDAWRNLGRGVGKKMGPKFDDLRRRYGKDFSEFWRSKSVQAKRAWKEATPKNYRSVAGLKFDMENFKLDLAGGRSNGRWRRSMLEGASRYQRLENKNRSSRRRYARVHIDNQAIKDVIEDAVDVLRDVDEVFRDKKLILDEHEYDKKIMKEPSLWRMIKRAQDDFGIHNFKELGQKARKFGKKMEQWDRKPPCPLFKRLEKINERIFRAMVRGFKVSDIPKDARMRWVNDMTRRVVDKLQRNPHGPIVEVWREMVHRSMRRMARDSARWWRSLGYDKMPEMRKWD